MSVKMMIKQNEKYVLLKNEMVAVLPEKDYLLKGLASNQSEKATIVYEDKGAFNGIKRYIVDNSGYVHGDGGDGGNVDLETAERVLGYVEQAQTAA